jgi:hypothetical protein
MFYINIGKKKNKREIGLDLIGLDWIGWDWIRLDWNGMD